jgi:hypothetical protein
MSSLSRQAATNPCELLDLMMCEFGWLSADGLRGDRAIEAFVLRAVFVDTRVQGASGEAGFVCL